MFPCSTLPSLPSMAPDLRKRLVFISFSISLCSLTMCRILRWIMPTLGFNYCIFPLFNHACCLSNWFEFLQCCESYHTLFNWTGFLDSSVFYTNLKFIGCCCGLRWNLKSFMWLISNARALNSLSFLWMFCCLRLLCSFMCSFMCLKADQFFVTF